MFRRLATVAIALTLTACVETSTGGVETTPYEEPVVQRSASRAIANYERVISRVEPVSERACRQIYPNVDRVFCDFVFEVANDPDQPPNAFQTIGKDGRPIIIFNIAMLRTVKNDHEIAFIMGHEAGHQIARHIPQKVNNATAGALIGGLLMATLGVDPQAGVDIGGMIGGQAYSKKFELQADRIGAHLSSRSGYNPLIGAESFRRTRGSNSLLSTHPPSNDRIIAVEQTVQTINAAKARGQVAPITW